jgi:outer membrane protein OmpA-like peptidoglycan-associated protein
MKRIFIIIVLCFVQFSNAQTPDVKRANRFFDKTFYTEAIPLYESIIEDNQSFIVLKNLADAYYYTNDYIRAQRLYANLVSRFKKDISEDYYFKYAQTLKVAGKYKEAYTVLHDYYVDAANVEAISRLDKDLLTLENVSAIGNRFEIKNLAMNTSSSEFGAVVNQGNFVFSGVDRSAGFLDKKFKWNGEKYLDVLSMPIQNINAADSVVKSFSNVINTEMHEANAVFTKDGKTVYFTRNNFIKGRRAKNQNKVSNLQIFKGEFVDGKWINIVALPFNNENYSVEHPALSLDEKTLYFASDMPGTLGSFDLFSVAIDSENFGTPKNLGPNINTAKKEQFPFVSKDGKLYFSSDGHAGYGSLDVFVVDLKGDNFDLPSNVGLPVNSAYDDFSFNIDADTKQGFFASNRAGGKGSDDIYQLNEQKPLIIEDCKQFVEGIVSDVDTKLPLSYATVVILDAKNVEVSRMITNLKGDFAFTVNCDTKYTVAVTKEEYTKSEKSFRVNKERDLRTDASVSLKSIVLLKKEEEVVAQMKREQEIALQEKNKASEIALVEKAKKDKAVAASKAAEQAKVDAKAKANAIVAAEKDVVKVDNQLIIKTDPIYFDYNLWYIRRDTRPVLDKVIDLMKKHPTMIVEISSHTDNRGNAKYNLDLSSKRANSTRDYFVKNGIEGNRILAKGYGESQQLIKCEPSESCTEEQHELNRRNVFTIKSL